MNKTPLTLAIDTSCDETSVSVVKGFQVLSNVIPTQIKFHKKYGGVVPSLAKLKHQERIDNAVLEALKLAKIKIEDVDSVSVTKGPGLAIALEVGLNKAKELAAKYRKPLITINHMEGHLLSSFATSVTEDQTDFQQILKRLQDVSLPSLGFLISGGHTELIHVSDFLNYKLIGQTLDDSCGEAYDKCGRILGLGYPAGPTISEFAKKRRSKFTFSTRKDNRSLKISIKNKLSGEVYELPVSMATSGDLNFSYSGLKTAFKNLVSKYSKNEISIAETREINVPKEKIYDLCVIFEAAAIEQLKVKLEIALKKNKFKEVWLGGGVVSSARVRTELRKLAKSFGAELKFPYSKKLFTDNAAMIGVAANIRYKLNIENGKLNKKELEEKGIYTKDFDKIDRKPNWSL